MLELLWHYQLAFFYLFQKIKQSLNTLKELDSQYSMFPVLLVVVPCHLLWHFHYFWSVVGVQICNIVLSWPYAATVHNIDLEYIKKIGGKAVPFQMFCFDVKINCYHRWKTCLNSNVQVNYRLYSLSKRKRHFFFMRKPVSKIRNITGEGKLSDNLRQNYQDAWDFSSFARECEKLVKCVILTLNAWNLTGQGQEKGDFLIQITA